MDWLTGTTAGKMLYAFLISMVPVIELRVGLPLAIAKPGCANTGPGWTGW